MQAERPCAGGDSGGQEEDHLSRDRGAAEEGISLYARVGRPSTPGKDSSLVSCVVLSQRPVIFHVLLDLLVHASHIPLVISGNGFRWEALLPHVLPTTYSQQ